ncbi:cell wall hydrolase [Heyndrickxia camelliae]|uniref:Peptidoglycan-binding protein n=1 Tax=Heyndrickxia camelliae TaxID=1707093 RepID=A0A2N3LPT0_9BACI|nr:cell wall hydrolase [Heyndrickxia camelliae]PKR86631.1 peptidoglycan-binding protein [Heyndrickxia camelliae]
MKKLIKLAVTAGLFASMSAFPLSLQSNAATTSHKVQSGETYWKIANKYGISVTNLMQVNHAANATLYAGQNIVIPNSTISAADRELMARLVHAEAGGEPYAGKVAVATVILNRLHSPIFPNSIKGVIYQVVSGHYAFTPVQDGRIKLPADADSRRAVNEAITFSGKGQGSLYFYNPKTAKSKWILSRHVTVTIGKHRFAK